MNIQQIKEQTREGQYTRIHVYREQLYSSAVHNTANKKAGSQQKQTTGRAI